MTCAREGTASHSGRHTRNRGPRLHFDRDRRRGGHRRDDGRRGNRDLARLALVRGLRGDSRVRSPAGQRTHHRARDARRDPRLHARRVRRRHRSSHPRAGPERHAGRHDDARHAHARGDRRSAVARQSAVRAGRARERRTRRPPRLSPRRFDGDRRSRLPRERLVPLRDPHRRNDGGPLPPMPHHARRNGPADVSIVAAGDRGSLTDAVHDGSMRADCPPDSTVIKPKLSAELRAGTGRMQSSSTAVGATLSRKRIARLRNDEHRRKRHHRGISRPDKPKHGPGGNPAVAPGPDPALNGPDLHGNAPRPTTIGIDVRTESALTRHMHDNNRGRRIHRPRSISGQRNVQRPSRKPTSNRRNTTTSPGHLRSKSKRKVLSSNCQLDVSDVLQIYRARLPLH